MAMSSGEVEVYDAALERATFSGSRSELRKGHHAAMEPRRRGSAHALSLAAQLRWSGCRRHGCRVPIGAKARAVWASLVIGFSLPSPPLP